MTKLTGEECYAPQDFDQVYEAFMAEVCTEQEWEVMRLRIQEELTLDEIGKRIGKSKERIRNIEFRVMRKLRYPLRRLPLLYGAKYMELLGAVKTAQVEYDKARLARKHEVKAEREGVIQKLREKHERLQKGIEDVKSVDSPQAKDILDNIPLRSMRLSARAQMHCIDM